MVAPFFRPDPFPTLHPAASFLIVNASRSCPLPFPLPSRGQILAQAEIVYGAVVAFCEGISVSLQRKTVAADSP